MSWAIPRIFGRLQIGVAHALDGGNETQNPGIVCERRDDSCLLRRVRGVELPPRRPTHQRHPRPAGTRDRRGHGAEIFRCLGLRQCRGSREGLQVLSCVQAVHIVAPRRHCPRHFLLETPPTSVTRSENHLPCARDYRPRAGNAGVRRRRPGWRPGTPGRCRFSPPPPKGERRKLVLRCGCRRLSASLLHGTEPSPHRFQGKPNAREH